MTARTSRRLQQLWQLPLLIISLLLFAYAAWLFVDPQPGLSADQKISVARDHLGHDRPEAALDQLRRVLATEKLDDARKAAVHLLAAESIEAAQKKLRINIVENHRRIIEQTRLAQAAGAKLDAAAHRRLGDSFTAIGKTPEAIANYRQAMMLDPATAVPLERRIVEAQIETRDFAGAMVSLESHLRREELSESERAWAMTAAARILIDRNELSEARQLLAQAMAFVADDPAEQGQVNYWLGYCQYRLGAAEEAERYLRLSRDQLKIQHPLDGEAAYLLGRILQARGEHAEAIAFFETVLVSHPGTDSAWLARLGRGVSRIARGDDDAGLSDLQDLVAKILSGEVQKVGPLDEVVGQLLAAGHRLIERGNYKGALEVMAWEQQVRPEPSATFFERLATVYEQRAGQVEKGLRQLTGAERVRAEQQLRELRTRAGDAHVAHARAVAAVSDAKYGESLWRGIEWYQSAGDLGRVISALELFIAERPDDPLTSEALLRLGRAFQAAGYYDKAIEAFQRNQFRFPNSLAAQKSAVPLAQALIARGGPSVARAETVLLGVIEGNDVLTPESQEFRLALQELAQLYYREGRFEEAIYRLVEITERYPGEQQAPRMRFLMADSYRKSAGLLADRIQVAQAGKAVREAMDLAEAVEARKERLTRAREIFAQVIEGYQARPPADALDQLYQKLAHFYLADTVYDLGEYAEAIRLYEAAAFRYQDDASSLAAYVQIVNANCALGRVDEARAAAERAKWLLRRMPPDAFASGSFSMPRQYWEQWLKWSTESGLW